MYRKPPYSFFKNVGHSIRGVAEVFAAEKAFRIEFAFFCVTIVVVSVLDLPFFHKCAMIAVPFCVMIAELVNSAVERAVDLVTQDHHELAKRAKDAAAGVVLATTVLGVSVWCAVLYDGLFR